MVATPRYGTMTFLGLQSGRNYSVDTYNSDVANAQVNFDSGNGAGSTSLTYWKAPENVKLIDWSVATGMADTTNMVMTSDGAQIPGSRIRYANQLNSLSLRPPLSVGFRAGANIGSIQVA